MVMKKLFYKEMLKIKFDKEYFKNQSGLYALYENIFKNKYLQNLFRLNSNYSLFDLIVYPFKTIFQIIGLFILTLWAIISLIYIIPKSFINYDYGEKNLYNHLDINRLRQDMFFDGNRAYLHPLKGGQFSITIEKYFELLAKYIGNDKVDYFIDEFINVVTEEIEFYSARNNVGTVKGYAIAHGLKEARKLFIESYK